MYLLLKRLEEALLLWLLATVRQASTILKEQAP